jgi:hypothetical protein
LTIGVHACKMSLRKQIQPKQPSEKVLTHICEKVKIEGSVMSFYTVITRRFGKGHTETEIAKHLNVNRITLRSWRTHEPSAARLGAVAKALRMNPIWLFAEYYEDYEKRQAKQACEETTSMAT